MSPIVSNDNQEFSMSFFSNQPYTTSDSLVFIFQGSKLLVKKNNSSISIPSGNDIHNSGIEISMPLFIGNLDQIPCFCAQSVSFLPESNFFGLHRLRELFGNISEQIFKMASLGLQVNNWDQISKYCGKCGRHFHLMKTERAKECLFCGHIQYPRISPAVIMAVTNGNKILLARSRHIKYSFYSVLAGYVEVGETLEECVGREVFEEVSISVKNIKYFGSQSWPFSNSLMIAFTAEHASGEILIDQHEILDAGWFSPENLPQLPGWGSIARQLVDSFVQQTIR
jgi:NAD+ diphosphatase